MAGLSGFQLLGRAITQQRQTMGFSSITNTFPQLLSLFSTADANKTHASAVGNTPRHGHPSHPSTNGCARLRDGL